MVPLLTSGFKVSRTPRLVIQIYLRDWRHRSTGGVSHSGTAALDRLIAPEHREDRVSLRISGKNMDVGDALRLHALAQI